MQRKTLLVVTSTFPRWNEDATSSFVFDLIIRLTDAYDVIVLAPHAHGASRYEIMQGIEVIRYRYFSDRGETLAYNSGIMNNLKNNPLNYLLLPFFLIAQIASLIALLCNREIDIIHAHWSVPNGVCAAIATIITNSKAKLVCTLHGSDLKLKNSIFKLAHQFVFKKSSHIVAVSQSLFEQAVAMGAISQKLCVISMGIDAQTVFTPCVSTESRKNLLFVGRLIKNKGVDILLQSFASVVSLYPEQKLSIVGDGIERSNLELLAKKLGLSNSVIFFGSKPHNEIVQFYQDSLIFISPTLSEGFGLAIAEAMACQCVVIASDLAAVAELIIDEQTGLLFQVGNLEMLTQCIVRLLKDPLLAESLSKQARLKIVKEHDGVLIANRYKKIFSGLLQN